MVDVLFTLKLGFDVSLSSRQALRIKQTKTKVIAGNSDPKYNMPTMKLK